MENLRTIEVNGLTITAYFDQRDMDGLFLPLLHKWTQLQQELGRRIFVFMAAPPGCGKSTLALFLESLSHSTPGVTPLQTVGLDGFHHRQAYLNSHFIPGTQTPLATIKGAPESFDVEKLRDMIAASLNSDPKWPLYDRQIHDVRDDQIQLRESIILLEGNYLLLEEEPWRSLQSFCDDSVFIAAEAEDLKDRLVSRKVAGGTAPDYAEAYVLSVDFPNIRRVLEHSAKANLMLKMDRNRFLPLL